MKHVLQYLYAFLLMNIFEIIIFAGHEGLRTMLLKCALVRIVFIIGKIKGHILTGALTRILSSNASLLFSATLRF